MKLYIDTSIYIAYLLAPTSDVKPLEKLVKLIKKNQVELVLPSQTKKEYLRKFEGIVKNEQDKIKSSRIELPIPPKLRAAKKDAQTSMERAIVKKIYSINNDLEKLKKKEAVEFERQLKRKDKLLNKIFKLATFFEYTDEVVLRAVIRYAKDLPPQKNDHKFGDAINWETLKENIRHEDLVIVTKDSDYQQKLGKNDKVVINSLLYSEWTQHTKKKITLYKSLGKFVNTLDKTDKVSQETIKKETSQDSVLASYSPSAFGSQGMNFPYAVSGALSSVIASSLSPSETVVYPTSPTSAVNVGSVLGSGFISPNTGILNISPPSLAEFNPGAGYLALGAKECLSCHKKYSPNITSGVLDNGLCDNCRLSGSGILGSSPLGTSPFGG